MTDAERKKVEYNVNELLYYVQNYSNSATKQELIETCSSFYTELEIEHAKAFQWAKCGNYGLPKISTRKGVGKLVSNVNDIVDCVLQLDWNKCPVKFGSVDATRVPPQKVGNHIDISNSSCMHCNDQGSNSVKHDIEEMKCQIQLLTDLITALTKSNTNNVDCTEPTSSYAFRAKKNNTNTNNADNNRLTNEKVELPAWNVVASRKKRKIVLGSNVSDTNLTAAEVVYKRDLHVTRLTMDMTAEKLTSYVSKKGVNVTDCELLEPPAHVKQPYTYKAFHLSFTCTDKSLADKLLDECEWPMGIAVRRFYVKKTNNGSA